MNEVFAGLAQRVKAAGTVAFRSAKGQRKDNKMPKQDAAADCEAAIAMKDPEPQRLQEWLESYRRKEPYRRKPVMPK